MRLVGSGLALALCVISPAAAEQPLVPASFPATTFNPHGADVTGMGTLVVPDSDATLKPFLSSLLGVHRFSVTLNRAGKILSCKTPARGKAGIALCNHIKTKGSFDRDRWLDLPFEGGTARYSLYGYTKGAQVISFHVNNAVGQRNIQVFFPREGVPTEGERVPSRFVARLTPQYPAWALREEVSGDVEAMVTFGEDGRVALCRPLHSTNTQLLAFETCRALRSSKLSVSKTPLRKWVVKTRWMLPE